MSVEFDRRSDWSDAIGLPGLLNRIHFTKPGQAVVLREGTEELPLQLPLQGSNDYSWGEVLSMLEAAEIIKRVSGATFERLDHPGLSPFFLDAQQHDVCPLGEVYELRNQESDIYRILRDQRNFKVAVNIFIETGNSEFLRDELDNCFRRFVSSECKINEDSEYRRKLTSDLIAMIVPRWPIHDDTTRSDVIKQFRQFISGHELGVRDVEILTSKADWFMCEMTRLSEMG